MRIRWRVGMEIDKVIEYRLKKRRVRLSPMEDMEIDWELKIDYIVIASLRLIVTNFGKFKKEVYGGRE